jgi:O-antigen/teichoic acid export membrane protein
MSLRPTTSSRRLDSAVAGADPRHGDQLPTSGAVGEPTTGDGALDAVRRVARNTTVQIGGDALSKLGSLAFYAVMARELGARGFGDFTFAVSVAVFIDIAGLGTDLLVTRDVARDRRRAGELFWNVNAIKLPLGLVGIAAAYGISLFAGYAAHITLAILILAMAKLAEILAKTFQAVFRGIEDMAPIALGLIAQRFFTAAVGITVLLAGAGLVGACLTYLGGAIIALVYLSWSLRRHAVAIGWALSAARIRELFVHSIPIGLSWTFGALLARLDAILLSLLKNDAAVGIYGASYRVFEATLLLGYTFSLAVLPVFSRLGRDSTPTLARAYELGCKVVVLFAVPVGAAQLLFPARIIAIFFGHQYVAGAPAMRWLGVATIFDALFAVSTQVLTVRDRRSLMTPIAGLAVVVNVILNLILIPRLSFEGAAIAMTVSEVTLALLMVVFAVRLSGNVSWFRVLLGPGMGGAAMTAAALVLGDGAPGIAASVVVYCAVVFAIERRLFPNDFRLLVHASGLTRPPAVNASAGASGG